MNNQLLIIGVGGAGVNITNYLLQSEPYQTVVVSRDKGILDRSISLHKSYIGRIQGRKKPVQQAIRKEMRRISRWIAGAETVVIIAGVGGATGSVGMTEIAKQSMEMGKITICIAIEPFLVEGTERCEYAAKVVDDLRPNVNILLSFSNEDLLELYSDLVVDDAFGKMNELITEMLLELRDSPKDYRKILPDHQSKIRSNGLTVA